MAETKRPDRETPVFISLCASWTQAGHPRACARLRAHGFKVIRMIYDLVPTLKPHWVRDHETHAITQWVHALLAESDHILTISEFSLREIGHYTKIQGLGLPPSSVVRLGDQLRPPANPLTTPPPCIGMRPFFLCVSTLDVRKNHRLLYDAWSLLAERHAPNCPALVCVGTPHLHVNNLIHEMTRDPAVRDHIHILHNVKDNELDWYYRNCVATIYPSRYEGWGLPIAESLGYGKLCLASNAASMPEIRPDLPVFFDPLDLYPFVALVERCMTDRAWVTQREHAIRKRFTPTSWRHTAGQIIALLGQEHIRSARNLVFVEKEHTNGRQRNGFTEMPPAVQVRISVTLACRDTDIIPKVKNAGRVVDHNGTRVQIMHEGSLIEADQYCGTWITEVIAALNGHHEPQEERIFHSLLPHMRTHALMVELGSSWAYYTNWFLGAVPGARAVCVEPDREHLELGRRNLALNNRTATMVHARMGGHYQPAMTSDTGELITPECLDMQTLCERLNYPPIEVLHMDIQGAELVVLKGLITSGMQHQIRFVFISTHHPSISDNPHIHEQCIDVLRSGGGHILTEHSIAASYSGDGLIVASFDPADLHIALPPISRAHPLLSALIWQWAPVAP